MKSAPPAGTRATTRITIDRGRTVDFLGEQLRIYATPELVRDFEIANGAGFLVALTGTMMRMPALPKIPAAERVDVNELGHITGV